MVSDKILSVPVKHKTPRKNLCPIGVQRTVLITSDKVSIGKIIFAPFGTLCEYSLHNKNTPIQYSNMLKISPPKLKVFR